MALGSQLGVRPVDVAKPSEAALTQHDKQAGRVSSFQDFRVGYFLLPRDAQDDSMAIISVALARCVLSSASSDRSLETVESK